MSLQYKIVSLTGAILAAMLVLAGAVGLAQDRFGRIADNLYDNAFVGVHYAHKVEVGFVRFEAAHQGRTGGRWTEADVKAMQPLLDDLDVAIERAPSPRERVLAQQLRVRISALL